MARIIKEEDLRLNIIVNGDDAKRKILEQEEVVSKLTGELKEQKAALNRLKSDGKERSINILQDAYPEYAGQILAKYYDTEEKILQLMGLGDIISIDTTIIECRPLKCGDKAQDTSLTRFFNPPAYIDYLYIFSTSAGWQYMPCHE